MAAATNIVYNSQHAGARFRFQRGGGWFAGTATLPSGQANCTVGKIPQLTDTSLVMVRSEDAAGGAKVIEIIASRSTGDQGTITVGTNNASNASADTAFSFYILNL